MLSKEQYVAVVEGNNFAVSQIEAGDYTTAIQVLNNALNLVNVDPLTSELFQTSLDVCMNLTERPPKYQDSATIYQGVDRYVYRHPMQISPTVGSKIKGSNTALSAILLFNFALAFLLLSECSKQSQPYLCMASKFYDVVLGLLGRDDQRLFDSSIFFSMAVVNNLGAIHHRLKEEDISKKYFQNLFFNLPFVLARNPVCEVTQGYLRNVFVSEGSSYIAAPSA